MIRSLISEFQQQGRRMTTYEEEKGAAPSPLNRIQLVTVSPDVFKAQPLPFFSLLQDNGNAGGCRLLTCERQHCCSLCSEAGNVIKEIGSQESSRQWWARQSRHNNTRPWRLKGGWDLGSPMFLFLLLRPSMTKKYHIKHQKILPARGKRGGWPLLEVELIVHLCRAAGNRDLGAKGHRKQLVPSSEQQQCSPERLKHWTGGRGKARESRKQSISPKRSWADSVPKLAGICWL